MKMSLVRSLVTSAPRRSAQFPTYPQYPWEQLRELGLAGPGSFLATPQQTLGFKQEEIRDTFTDYVRFASQGNPIVYALMERRRQVFSQAHFRFQQLRNGTPGDYFGTAALDPLNGPGRDCQDLMSQAIQDADHAGTAVIVAEDGGFATLRPDWVTIVAASKRLPDLGVVAPDARVIGLAYMPGGKYSGADPVLYLPGEFGLFRYTPDPVFRFKGVSWIKAAVNEVMADNAATTHKLKFFENGATPNMVVSLDPAITIDKFNAWVEKFEQGHEGVLNAYKTLYLGGGADAEVVGANLRQIDFKVTQGAGETRLSADAGVPPIVGGFSEGLASATYSNYGQARRAFSDITLWDLWGKMSKTLEQVIPPPRSSRIWVDSSQIPFLQEDVKDEAEILSRKMLTIESGIRGGYEPDSVVKAVASGDLTLLKHTGLFSVQLQPPSTTTPRPEAPPADVPKSPARMAVEGARAQLIEAGVVRPTNAQIAEHLGVSDRTVQRWKGETAA